MVVFSDDELDVASENTEGSFEDFLRRLPLSDNTSRISDPDHASIWDDRSQNESKTSPSEYIKGEQAMKNSEFKSARTPMKHNE